MSLISTNTLGRKEGGREGERCHFKIIFSICTIFGLIKSLVENRPDEKWWWSEFPHTHTRTDTGSGQPRPGHCVRATHTDILMSRRRRDEFFMIIPAIKPCQFSVLIPHVSLLALHWGKLNIVSMFVRRRCSVSYRVNNICTKIETGIVDMCKCTTRNCKGHSNCESVNSKFLAFDYEFLFRQHADIRLSPALEDFQPLQRNALPTCNLRVEKTKVVVGSLKSVVIAGTFWLLITQTHEYVTPPPPQGGWVGGGGGDLYNCPCVLGSWLAAALQV